MSPDAGQDLSIIEAALKRDRIIVLLGLAGIAILAWVYTVHAAWEMNNMDIETCMGLSARSWGLTDLTLLFLMWTVMMAAMMIPSVSQMVLLYAGSVRRNGRETGVVRLTGIFVLGYLASWTGFSLLATLAQWGLHEAALIEQRQRAEDRGAADAQARAGRRRAQKGVELVGGQMLVRRVDAAQDLGALTGEAQAALAQEAFETLRDLLHGAEIPPSTTTGPAVRSSSRQPMSRR